MKVTEENWNSFEEKHLGAVFDNRVTRNEEFVEGFRAKFAEQDEDENVNITKPSINVADSNGIPEDMLREQNSDNDLTLNNVSLKNLEELQVTIACYNEKSVDESEDFEFAETKIEIEDHELIEYNGCEVNEFGEEYNKTLCNAVECDADTSFNTAKILSNIIVSTPIDNSNTLTNTQEAGLNSAVNYLLNLNVVEKDDECGKRVHLGMLNTSEELTVLLKRENLQELQKKLSMSGTHTVKKKTKWHRWRSNQSKQFWCKLCPFTSDDKFSLMVHIAENHKEEAEKQLIFIQYMVPGGDRNSVLYKCTHCDYQTGLKWSFSKHLVKHKQMHEVETFRCNKCDMVTKHKNGLVKHLKLHRLGDEADFERCPYCNFKTRNKSYMSRHIMMIHKTDQIEKFECKMCGFKTKYEKSFENHLLTHSSSRELHKCSQCPLVTHHKRVLRTHVLTTHQDSEEATVYCAHCDYKTKFKETLKRHLLTHKSPDRLKMIKCGLCPFETKHKSYILKHRRLHLVPDKKEMLPCNLCSYRGKTMIHLKRHLKQHKKPEDCKMFKCGECSYQSRNHANVKRHHLVHMKSEELTWFRCDTCSYKAKNKDRLRTHFNTVHRNDKNVRWYSCERCDYQTKLLGNLARHLLVHINPSKANKFQCKHCSFSTKTKRQIQDHLSNRH